MTQGKNTSIHTHNMSHITLLSTIQRPRETGSDKRERNRDRQTNKQIKQTVTIETDTMIDVHVCRHSTFIM